MDSLRFVGLDVHKETIAVAVADDGRGAAAPLGIIPNDPAAIRKLIRRLGSAKRLRCGYEAGSCGYVLYHQLTELGVACKVVAPSLVPRRPGDRVKTDRRDAVKLALGLRAGTLTAIWVPEPGDEALRDLVRAREDARQDLLRYRHRLSKLLLRQGVATPPGMRSWSQAHRRWLDELRLAHRAQQVTFEEYRLSIDQVIERIRRLEAQLLEVVDESHFAEIIAALQALYGVGFITAVTVATEIQDFTRFTRPRQLSGYAGLGASEYSSGSSQRRGPITKAGNGHLRRVLVEAAWHYQRTCKRKRRRRPGQEQLPAWLQAMAAAPRTASNGASPGFWLGKSRARKPWWRWLGSCSE
jgi:transposase